MRKKSKCGEKSLNEGRQNLNVGRQNLNEGRQNSRTHVSNRLFIWIFYFKNWLETSQFSKKNADTLDFHSILVQSVVL